MQRKDSCPNCKKKKYLQKNQQIAKKYIPPEKKKLKNFKKT
jgi:hypothetical protein